MNPLEKYELEDLEESQVLENENEGWKIDSLDSADWAFRKIATLKQSNDEIKRFADSDRDRIADWEQKETQSNKDSIAFFEHKLSEYLYEKRKTDKKAVIKTPHGRVSTRKQPDSWEIKEDDAIKEFEELGLNDFVRIKKEINKKDLKKAVNITEEGKAVTEDGEVLRFVKVVPQGETVVVKEAK